MEYKVEKHPCHGRSWRANAFECVNFGGKCLALWRQMPLGVGANDFECVGRCLWLSFSLSLSLTLSLSLAFALTFTWWRIAVILALTCLHPLLSVLFFVLSSSLSLSSVPLFSTILAVACVLVLDFFLSLSVSLCLWHPFSLSHSFPLSLSLSLSLSLFLSFSLTLSFPFSLRLSVRSG